MFSHIQMHKGRAYSKAPESKRRCIFDEHEQVTRTKIGCADVCSHTQNMPADLRSINCPVMFNAPVPTIHNHGPFQHIAKGLQFSHKVRIHDTMPAAFACKLFFRKISRNHQIFSVYLQNLPLWVTFYHFLIRFCKLLRGCSFIK